MMNAWCAKDERSMSVMIITWKTHELNDGDKCKSPVGASPQTSDSR